MEIAEQVRNRTNELVCDNGRSRVRSAMVQAELQKDLDRISRVQQLRKELKIELEKYPQNFDLVNPISPNN